MAYGRIPGSHRPHIPSRIVPIIHPYPVPEFPFYNGAESHTQPVRCFLHHCLPVIHPCLVPEFPPHLVPISDLQPAGRSLPKSIPMNHPVPVLPPE